MKKIGFLLFLGSFLLFSCRKQKTTWNSDWVAPLVNDTLSLENLVNDSTLSISSGTTYEVDLTRTIFDYGIEDVIGIPDTLIVHSFNSSAASITVPPGFSIVNEIEEHEMIVDDIQLKKIRVSAGTISMEVFNPINTNAFFTIKLPGVTKDGIVFQDDFVAPAGTQANPGTVTANLDISGYSLDLTGQDGSGFNLLQSQLIVTSDPAGPSVILTSAQIFKVEAEFKGIKVDYARGYFGHLIESDTTSFTIDMMNMVNAGTLDLPSPQIQFEIINGLKVDAKATISLVSGTNYAGNTVTLNNSQIGSPIYLDPATGSWGTLSNSTETITFNSSNSNVESYLENLSRTHTIGYKIELNPWGNTSGGWNEIFPNSRVKVKLKAQMPLALGVDGLTLRDTFDFEINQDPTKTHVESGILVLNASNAFPFSSNVKLFLMNDQGTVLHTIIGTTAIQSSLFGLVDPNDGKLKMNSELNFVLTEAMLNDLDLIKKIAVETQFNTPDPISGTNQSVSIPVGAFLAVKLKAKLNLKAIF